jgi:glycerophosphoryl diester phosphodiesterase
MSRSRLFRLSLLTALAVALPACDTFAPAPAPHPDLVARLRSARFAAHRGGYGFPDSNTVARFEVTRRQGADIVETDLRVSRDGVVFLFHDELLDRKTVCKGRLASYTAAELERCHLLGLERGPDRFEDALRWSSGRVVIDAELKTGDAARPAIDLVRKYDAYDWVYFQVGDSMRTYQQVRDYDARVGLEAGPRSQSHLREFLSKSDSRLVLIQLRPGFFSSQLLDEVHGAGKLVSLNAWLLAPEDESASCSRAFALGVDVAVTNSPAACTKQRSDARALSSLEK